jgi:hypothetical protein
MVGTRRGSAKRLLAQVRVNIAEGKAAFPKKKVRRSLSAEAFELVAKAATRNTICVVVHDKVSAVIVASPETSVLEASIMHWVLGKVPASVTSQMPVEKSSTVTVTAEGQELVTRGEFGRPLIAPKATIGGTANVGGGLLQTRFDLPFKQLKILAKGGRR